MTVFHLIKDQAGLDAFALQNKGIEWMCFDTEFVGEKRFFTRLCLMQVATRFGNYLIDPFPIPDFGPVLRMIQDPAIVKVTHAGESAIFHREDWANNGGEWRTRGPLVGTDLMILRGSNVKRSGRIQRD